MFPSQEGLLALLIMFTLTVLQKYNLNHFGKLKCSLQKLAFKGIYLSKPLTCMKLLLYKQKCVFIKETDTFGHVVG